MERGFDSSEGLNLSVHSAAIENSTACMIFVTHVYVQILFDLKRKSDLGLLPGIANTNLKMRSFVKNAKIGDVQPRLVCR